MAVVVVAGAGWFAYDRFLAGDSAAARSEAPADGSRDAAGEERTAGGKTTDELLQEADRLAAGSLGQVSRATAERITAHLGTARSAMDAGDWEAAIVSYDAVLELDPENAEAGEGLREAGKHYRARKAQQAEFDRAVRAFESGDYTSALRVLYRLPADIRPEDARALKIEGWYNLGLVELRAGDLEEATAHFEEAIAIDAEDGPTREALEFVDEYRGQPKDSMFYAAVEGMEFRGPTS
jgi:tetratricopeptide (TPR) repeat protein